MVKGSSERLDLVDDVKIGEHEGRVVRVTPRETILFPRAGGRRPHARRRAGGIAEDPILDAHVREELAAPGSRDLLREGQTHAT